MLWRLKIESQGRSRALFNLGGKLRPSASGVQAYAASRDASDIAAGPALLTPTLPVPPA